MTDCGIYKITNTVNGNFYIGSANNLQRRIREHKRALAANAHCNRHLQNSWNKYGEQSFEFTAVLLCNIESKLYFEQVLLDGLKPAYNIATNAKAPRQGLHMSEETKHKLLKANIGRHLSEEHKHKMSEARKGELNHFFGKCHSDETKSKIGEANKGKLNYWFGKHHTEEEKQKLREVNTGIHNSNFGKHLSEEQKRKLSEFNAGRHHTEESKRKMSENKKRYYAEKKAKLEEVAA